jgi:hypothetical protein
MSIDRAIRCRRAIYMTNRMRDAIYAALDKIMRPYTNSGFRIQVILADGEFAHFIEQVSDEMDVRINPTSVDEHVPEAERNNRMIKERVRSIFANAWFFTRLPRVAIQKVVEKAAMLTNLLPANNGISETLSPYTILWQMQPDFRKHATMPLLTYVQANADKQPTNTMEPRTIDCLYLGPIFERLQPAYELLNLDTGKIITRRNIRPVPVTNQIINRVHELADADGMKHLRVTDKYDNKLLPAAWLAGVDYDENLDDEEDYDPTND